MHRCAAENVTTLSQAKAASHVGVSATIWHEWESSEDIPLDRYEDIDQALDGQGVLCLLLKAATTPAASAITMDVQPSRLGTMVGVGAGTGRRARSRVRCPLRPAEPHLAIGQRHRACDRHAPRHAEPGARNRLPRRARVRRHWAEPVPARFGIPVVDARQHARMVRSTHEVDIVVQRLRELLRVVPGWERKLDSFLGGTGFIRDALTLARTELSPADVRRSPAEVKAPAAGPALRRARDARGLSRPRAASLVSGLDPAYPVSEDQVRRLEAGHQAQVWMLWARLDITLGADGHLCCEPVPAQRSRLHNGWTEWTIEFPSWWVGPVWLKITHGSDAVPLVILWRPWKRDFVTTAGQTLAFRRATKHDASPLVRLPIDAALEAGIGRPPASVEVSDGWHVADRRDASRSGSLPSTCTSRRSVVPRQRRALASIGPFDATA